MCEPNIFILPPFLLETNAQEVINFSCLLGNDRVFTSSAFDLFLSFVAHPWVTLDVYGATNIGRCIELLPLVLSMSASQWKTPSSLTIARAPARCLPYSNSSQALHAGRVEAAFRMAIEEEGGSGGGDGGDGDNEEARRLTVEDKADLWEWFEEWVEDMSMDVAKVSTSCIFGLISYGVLL